MTRPTPKGISLGVTLLVVSLLATLGFALASASVTHLQLRNRAHNESAALNLARSVVAEGLERVFTTETFGEAREEAASLDVTLQGTLPESTGRLTFHEATASDRGIRYSSNNLLGTTQLDVEEGFLVPPYCLHLVGVGESGGVERSVEVVLRLTMFPYAVVASGPVKSEGSLTIAALEQPGVVDEEALLPADLISNNDGTEAVVLSVGTKITGNVQAPGKIVLPADPSTFTVWGAVSDGADPVQIPRLDLSRFDPELRGISSEALDGVAPVGDPLLLEGAVRSSAPLTIDADLQLDGCLLYVQGDLVVNGAVTGEGIIAATGNVTVTRGATLDGANKLALLSGGDVSLTGTDAEFSYFQGLVYSQGAFDCDRVTVVGALVVDGDNTDQVRLRNARVFHDPQAGEVQLGGGGGEINPLMYFWMPDLRNNGWIDIESVPPVLEVYDFGGPSKAFPDPITSFPLPTDLLPDEDAVHEFLAQIVRDENPGLPEASVTLFADGHLALVRDKLAEFRGSAEGWPEEAFKIEPSEVLRPNERSRVLLWKES